jgi:hypothetical protein
MSGSFKPGDLIAHRTRKLKPRIVLDVLPTGAILTEPQGRRGRPRWITPQNLSRYRLVAAAPEPQPPPPCGFCDGNPIPTSDGTYMPCPRCGNTPSP